jgi:glycerophosphoryl diester phosphodiesterase
MLKIAHRGLSEHYPDNSKEAFIEAIKNGFDMLEVDIQLCKKNNIVIFHDTYFLSKAINEFTLEECQKYGMLSLNELLTFVDTKKIKLFLDIKGSAEISNYLVDLLLIHKVYFPNIYISGFDRNHIKLLKSHNLNYKIGFTCETNYTIEDLEYLSKSIDFICMHWTALNQENITYLQNKSLEVFSYTAKDYYILNYMKKYSLDGIISNFDF